jgi:hypothetical protein
MASISAVKAYDMLQTCVCLDELPRCNAIKHVFGMANISATFVLGAWQGIFFHKIMTVKQIVEAIQQNRLESVFKDCCSKLATVNHHYAQKVLERYAAKGDDKHSLIINFGLFNLRPETAEESIRAFKNYITDLRDFAEECKDTDSYVALVTAGIRVPKPLAEIKTEMRALVIDFESTMACMPPDAAAKAADALTDAKGVLSSLEQFE